VWLAEADVMRGDHRLNEVGNAEIDEVAPVLVRVAHLDVAEHDAAHSEVASGFEQCPRIGKQDDAGRRRGMRVLG
jgi:hypothetical protein